MKKFFDEFKKFITRGNVIDMAVGVTVGAAFTAVVTAVSNNILKPIINYAIGKVLGKETLSEAFTFLQKVTDPVTKTVDLENSIYIDWGAFVSALINFLVVAFVLFCIVKAINTMTEKQKALSVKLLEGSLSKEDKKAMKNQGLNPKNKADVEAYIEKKTADAADAAAQEEAAAAAEREANPTTEDLLKKIVAILENK